MTSLTISRAHHRNRLTQPLNFPGSPSNAIVFKQRCSTTRIKNQDAQKTYHMSFTTIYLTTQNPSIFDDRWDQPPDLAMNPAKSGCFPSANRVRFRRNNFKGCSRQILPPKQKKAVTNGTNYTVTSLTFFSGFLKTVKTILAPNLLKL